MMSTSYNTANRPTVRYRGPGKNVFCEHGLINGRWHYRWVRKHKTGVFHHDRWAPVAEDVHRLFMEAMGTRRPKKTIVVSLIPRQLVSAVPN